MDMRRRCHRTWTTCFGYERDPHGVPISVCECQQQALAHELNGRAFRGQLWVCGVYGPRRSWGHRSPLVVRYDGRGHQQLESL